MFLVRCNLTRRDCYGRECQERERCVFDETNAERCLIVASAAVDVGASDGCREPIVAFFAEQSDVDELTRRCVRRGHASDDIENIIAASASQLQNIMSPIGLWNEQVEIADVDVHVVKSIRGAIGRHIESFCGIRAAQNNRVVRAVIARDLGSVPNRR